MRLGPEHTVVVTGAAHGIGAALAREAARRGCRLALVDVDQPGLAKTREDLEGAGAVSLHRVDVADPVAMTDVAEAVRQAHGAADVLINNAGVGLSGRIEALSQRDLEWIVGVNFWGVVHGCRAFLPQMQRLPEARIAAVLSGFAFLGFPSKAGYCASKSAARAFCEALQQEVRGSQVRVTCLYPGPTRTAIAERGRAVDPALAEEEGRFLARRGLAPDRVARAALLATERGDQRCFIGLEPRVMDWLTRLSPGFAARLTAAVAARLPFVDRAGR